MSLIRYLSVYYCLLTLTGL